MRAKTVDDVTRGVGRAVPEPEVRVSRGETLRAMRAARRVRRTEDTEQVVQEAGGPFRRRADDKRLPLRGRAGE